MKLTIIPLLFLSTASYAECANRVVIDKLQGNDGQELVTQYSRTSCNSSENRNFDVLVGSAKNCRTLWVDGVKVRECQNASGQYKEITEMIGNESKFPKSTQPDIRRDYSKNDSLIGVAVNVFKKWHHSLPDAIADLHNNAVKIALEQGQNGDTVSWADPKFHAHGNIRVVSTSIKTGEVCRTMLIDISYRTPRSVQEIACFNSQTQEWVYNE